MSELHVNQTRDYLTRELTGKIDLSDLAGTALGDSDALFLSRCLAAYSLIALIGTSGDQAGAAVTDGSWVRMLCVQGAFTLGTKAD